MSGMANKDAALAAFMLPPYNMATRAAPFDSLRIADLGDVAINTFNLEKSVAIIESYFDRVLEAGTIPL